MNSLLIQIIQEEIIDLPAMLFMERYSRICGDCFALFYVSEIEGRYERGNQEDMCKSRLHKEAKKLLWHIIPQTV